MDPKTSPVTQAILSQEALNLLEQHHQFPGEYMFKAIGFGGEDFVERARLATESVLGPLKPGDRVSSRPSSGKRYTSVTLEVAVASAQQVLEVYTALRKLEGLVVLV